MAATATTSVNITGKGERTLGHPVVEVAVEAEEFHVVDSRSPLARLILTPKRPPSGAVYEMVS